MANTYNSKNYMAHGGAELVIGGKLTFLDGAEVENFPGSTSSGATGGKPYVADSEATTVANLKNDFNALLAVLRTAGVLSSEAPASSGTDSTDETGGGEG